MDGGASLSVHPRLSQLLQNCTPSCHVQWDKTIHFLSIPRRGMCILLKGVWQGTMIPSVTCDAVEYREICCNDKGNSRLFLPLQLKLVPHLSASHCHLEARVPWSSTMERKLEIRKFTLCYNILISISLMRLECHNLLFCKREYKYVFYNVRLRKLELCVQHIRKE